MHALLDPFDQGQLPLQSVELPCAEGEEAQAHQQGAGGGEPPGRGRTGRWREGARGGHHGACLIISVIMPGIMLWFMWYMTQIEPDNMITTSIRVNSMASIDQPCSTLEFMCRK